VSDEAVSQQRLQVIASRLREQFKGVFSSETIERSVAESVAATEHARIQTFRAIFVERFARDRLAELEAQTETGRRRRS
jgi:hypothetical protein